MEKFFSEILGDILAEVRTSPPPLPDFDVYEIRKAEFDHQVRKAQSK